MKRIFLLAAALVCVCSFAFGLDYGAILSGQYTTEELDDESGRTNRVVGTLAPWLSLPLGGADFYFSAGGRADYSDSREDDEVLYVPDVYRLEISGKPSDRLFVKAGRTGWHDPSRLVADGRFDGAEARFDGGSYRVSLAGFYTGFLYYDTAEINVSPTDPKAADYSADFDWDNFEDTYFAPRRAFAALTGEFTGVFSERGNLAAGVLAQFDLSDAEERFHTQYLLLRYSLGFGQFDFALAGAAELENTDEEDTRAAYAASAEIGARLPGAVRDRLFLGAKLASGEEGNQAAFFPLVRRAQGLAFQQHLSGIMAAYLGYEARLHEEFSVELSGRYFIRTDDTTVAAPYLKDDSSLLGLEVGGSLLWVPVSDLSFSLAGGAFLPKTGSAFEDEAPVLWSLTLGTVLSF